MKRFLLLACCLLSFSAFSQTFDVVYSEPFDENEDAAHSLVQCANGNTLMFDFTKDNETIVHVYDGSRKKIATETSTIDAWSSKRKSKSHLNGMLAMRDEVVVFIQNRDEEPILYRVRFSAATGKKLDEARTAVIAPEARAVRRASKYADVVNAYSIVKDTKSDAYAIVYSYPYDLDGAAKPTLMHFNAQHEEIGRTLIDAPGGKFAFIYYEDMVVSGTDEVFLCTRPWNNGKGNREASGIMLSKLRGNTVSHAMLYSWNSNKPTTSWMKYNAKENTLQLLSRVLMSTKTVQTGPNSFKTTNNYAAGIAAIDKDSLTLKYNKTLDYQKASEFRRKYYDIPAAYTGLPEALEISPDGLATVVSEEDGSLPSHDLSVVDYNNEGAAVNGFAIRKGTISGPRSGGGWADAGYYAYKHVASPTARYVFFNDHPANFERNAEKTPKALTGVSDANTICYRIKDGQLSKSYLFGDPNKDFDNRFANFYRADLWDPLESTCRHASLSIL